MVKHGSAAPKVEGVVNAVADEEVDEVTEVLPHSVTKDIRPENLDSFLQEQFETSTKENELGMPPVSWLKAHLKTKSACIRYLHHKQFKTKDIAKHLGVRYQHVRNVLTTELKRGPNEGHNITEDYISPTMSHLDDFF